MTDDESAISSDALRAAVQNFMDRADKVTSHPLANNDGAFRVDLRINEETGQLSRIDLDMQNLEESGWAYLATVMRPIIFLTNDPISIPVITGRIEREHAALRGRLKPLRTSLNSWRTHIFLGSQMLGKATNPLPEGESRVERLWAGEVGTLPEDVNLDGMIGDVYFADVFFNGYLWHSDTEKAVEFQAASPLLRSHILKCAEIRTLSAIEFVTSLRNWIVGARAAGFDF